MLIYGRRINTIAPPGNESSTAVRALQRASGIQCRPRKGRVERGGGGRDWFWLWRIDHKVTTVPEDESCLDNKSYHPNLTASWEGSAGSIYLKKKGGGARCSVNFTLKQCIFGATTKIWV